MCTSHRRAADRLRRAEAHLRILVREHDQPAFDLDLGVADLAFRAAHAHALGRAERFLVEVDRRRRAVDAEIRRHARIVVGDGFDGHGRSFRLMIVLIVVVPPSILLGEYPMRTTAIFPIAAALCLASTAALCATDLRSRGRLSVAARTPRQRLHAGRAARHHRAHPRGQA